MACPWALWPLFSLIPWSDQLKPAVFHSSLWLSLYPPILNWWFWFTEEEEMHLLCSLHLHLSLSRLRLVVFLCFGVLQRIYPFKHLPASFLSDLTLDHFVCSSGFTKPFQISVSVSSPDSLLNVVQVYPAAHLTSPRGCVTAPKLMCLRFNSWLCSVVKLLFLQTSLTQQMVTLLPAAAIVPEIQESLDIFCLPTTLHPPPSPLRQSPGAVCSVSQTLLSTSFCHLLLAP